ncbi:hypothetical protein HD554DRAFT_2040427 [Boletus coccyginus]|nr:hypothetical protein HD554DRAFT_2040427 [Boletus coccyginus]
MPWPEEVIRQFETVPLDVDVREHHFYGPYNKLLCSLFPLDTRFTVVPRYHEFDSLTSSDFVVCFEIVLENRPVFVLELKRPIDLKSISKRALVDIQIRRRLRSLGGACPIQILHGVSAFGTRLGFYRLDTTDPAADILPMVIDQDPESVNDTAPREW